jgi:hypothetical protein
VVNKFRESYSSVHQICQNIIWIRKKWQKRGAFRDVASAITRQFEVEN